MAAYVAGTRRYAAANPDAHYWRRPISEQDYLNTRMISTPLALLDFDAPVDGAGALVVTTAERARDLPVRPAYLAGYAALGFDYLGQSVPTWEVNLAGARAVAQRLWANSGFSPADVDNLHVYDSVSHLVYLWLEAFGFCGEGEAHAFVEGGRTEVGGPLPVNTSGGSLGMGRLHGGAQLLEAVRQVQGGCGPRQVENARLALAITGLPTAGAAAVLVSKEPVN